MRLYLSLLKLERGFILELWTQGNSFWLCQYHSGFWTQITSVGNVNKPFKRINEYKYIQRDITGHLSFMESQSSLSFAIWSGFWTESKSERFHLVLPHICFPIWNFVKSLSLSIIEPKAMSWTGFRLRLLAPEQQSCKCWIRVSKSPPKLGAKQDFFYQLQGSCMAA